MKKLLLFIFSILSLASLSQTVASSCQAPDSIVKKYRYDANKMAVNRAYHINAPFKDSVEINTTLRDFYLKALLAVYNATALPARDSVVSMYNIHVYNPGLGEVSVKADSNLVWMKKLHANNLPTGNAAVDYLISKHYLKKTLSLTGISPYTSALLKTDTNCNTQALAKKFKAIQGVFMTDYDFIAGDGSNIEDSVTTGYMWLVYDYGWEDCIDGCSNHRFWQFKVYNDCSVEYGGSFGVPVTVGIRGNAVLNDEVKVYPNPTSGKLHIHSEAGDQRRIRLTLTNTLGQTVLFADKTDLQREIDLTFLPKGIYYLRVGNGAVFKTIKVLKE